MDNQPNSQSGDGQLSGLNEIVEPLTGSSVIIEPLPNNVDGNSNLPEKKPNLIQRLDARSKKDHIQLITFLSVIIVVIMIAILFTLLGKTSHLDYSQSYSIAKSLKREVQSIRNDSSCNKVTDYVSKSFVTMDTFNDYIQNCQTIGDGPAQYIDQLAQTEGVRQDQEIKRRYELFVEAYDTVSTGSKTLAITLDQYLIWHKWVIALTANTSEINWTDSDLDSTAKILLESDVPAFTKYAQDWRTYFGEYVVASREYYTASFSDENKEELRNTMTDKKKAYEDWKNANEPNIPELIPLENPDLAYLYAKFEDFYNAVRQAYQDNYNKTAGGCKELSNQVVCD